MSLFDMLGLLMGLYVLYAALTGEVYAKSGVWGRTVSRSESPANFWMTVVIYTGLAVALVTLF